MGRLRRIVRYGLVILAVVAFLPVLVIGVFRWVNPPVTAYMLRVQMAESASIHRHWAGLDAISACMPLAVVASEDQTFPTNHGFAWGAIRKAIMHDLGGGHLRGASTITQQTAKNLFLWPARNLLRKGIEAWLTVWIDLLWSKRRIIEVYLNIVQFDDHVFGVDAAARRLFGVPPGRLSRRQCATLAAVLPAPEKYSASRPGAYIRQRRRWILRQMRQLGRAYLDNVLAR